MVIDVSLMLKSQVRISYRGINAGGVDRMNTDQNNSRAFVAFERIMQGKRRRVLDEASPDSEGNPSGHAMLKSARMPATCAERDSGIAGF